MDDQTIQIFWDGPFSREDVAKFTGATDKGLYQVYTYHPIYGDCLVYIGLTDTTFANRTLSHNYEAGSDNDRRRTCYYIGRLIGLTAPAEGQWKEEIKKAEMLLIHAHAPAYNSTNIQSVGKPAYVANVRVLNWGNCRSLQREVSGRMWSAPINPGLRPYGSGAEQI